MPRSPRLLLSKSYYHIITRGNNGNAVFKCDNDYRYYLAILTKYKEEHPFELYHYCLMPTHIHLLVQTKGAADFSNFMKRLNLAYCHHFKQEYGWVGHFWQSRFRSQVVGKDSYFIQCGKYIELNPCRAGLVNKPEDYSYSSYSYYALGKDDLLITPDFIYKDLGKDAKHRQKLFQRMIVSDLVMQSYKSQAWGSRSQRYNETQKISRSRKSA